MSESTESPLPVVNPTLTPTESTLALLLGGWAKRLPDRVRKAVYRDTKLLAGLATVVLLILPNLGMVGVHLSSLPMWTAAATFMVAVASHIADANTTVYQPSMGGSDTSTGT